jgi:hypothetical protein
LLKNVHCVSKTQWRAFVFWTTKSEGKVLNNYPTCITVSVVFCDKWVLTKWFYNILTLSVSEHLMVTHVGCSAIVLNTIYLRSGTNVIYLLQGHFWWLLCEIASEYLYLISDIIHLCVISLCIAGWLSFIEQYVITLTIMLFSQIGP